MFRRKQSYFFGVFVIEHLVLDHFSPAGCPPPPTHSAAVLCGGPGARWTGLGRGDENKDVLPERPPRFYDEGVPLPYFRGAEPGGSVRGLRVQRLGGAQGVRLASTAPASAWGAQGEWQGWWVLLFVWELGGGGGGE